MDRGAIRSRKKRSVMHFVCPIVKPKPVPSESQGLFVPFSDHRLRRNTPGFLEWALAKSRDKALVVKRERNSGAACAALGEGLGKESEDEVGSKLGLRPFQILLLRCVFLIMSFLFIYPSRWHLTRRRPDSHIKA